MPSFSMPLFTVRSLTAELRAQWLATKYAVQLATGSVHSPLQGRQERYWIPSERLLQSIRDYGQARQMPGKLARGASRVAVIRHRFWSAVTGADVPINCSGLGRGLHLPHPTGVVFHPHVQLGSQCRIFQNVTLGTGPKLGVPRLGVGVEVGAGAKILGGVTVGDYAKIGANAVVLSDVPAGATAVGIPAVISRVQPLLTPLAAE